MNLAINEKLRIKFDWFPVTEDITMANLCFNQAINLVYKHLFWFKNETKIE